MNPYPLLLWLEENGGAVTGGTAAAYCKAPQEPIPALPGARPDLYTGDAYDARPSPVIGESEDHHDRSPERENRSESGPDEKDLSGKLGGWIGTTGEDPRSGSTDRSEREDGAGNDLGETSAPTDGEPAASGARTSRSSVGDDSPGAKIREEGRLLVPDPRSSRTMRRYYASILAYASRKADEIRKPEISEDREDEKNAGKKDRDDKKRDGRYADTSEKDRSASKTGAAQPRPVPHEKGAGNTPGSEEDPEMRPEPPSTGKSTTQASTPEAERYQPEDK